MNMKQALAVLLATLATAQPMSSMARDKDGNYLIQSSKNCGRYVRDFKNDGDERRGNIYWIAGYITAYNAWGTAVWNIMGKSDILTIERWMVSYCEANPGRDTAEGMNALVIELTAEHPDMKSPG